MAGRNLIRPGWPERGLVHGAPRSATGAARMEPAAGGQRLNPGITPGMAPRRPSPSSPGRQAIRARVYGWAGARKIVAIGASSTMRPAYITITRWHICEMMPRSWETRSTAMPISRASCRMRASTWAWMVTSRAVVGSSAMSRLGVQATPMPIITRWAMPPENWCG